MSLKTEHAVLSITQAYNVLVRTTDLSPRNPDITAALTSLVQSLSDEFTAEEEHEILSDTHVQDIREEMLDKLAAAEGEMEKFWAEYYLNKQSLSFEDLQEFWYWDNYQELVAAELPHIAAAKKGSAAPRQVAFVGAGALPLTPIILHLRTGARVTCIDSDPQACAQAQHLMNRLGLSDRINIRQSRGEDFDYCGHDAVIVAALVPDKDNVVKRVKETAADDVLIGVRSAERLHSLLYAPVDEKTPHLRSCTFLSKTFYDPRLINTTLFYKTAASFNQAAEGDFIGYKRTPEQLHAPSKCASCMRCKRLAHL